MDGSNEGLSIRPDRSVRQDRPSVNARERTRGRTYADLAELTYGERALVKWLELRCFRRTPKRMAGWPIAAVAEAAEMTGYVGARALLLKRGWRLVVQAVKDMTERVDQYGDGEWRRAWRADIVSPAQYLNWYCGELAGDIRRPRRRYSDEDRGGR